MPSSFHPSHLNHLFGRVSEVINDTSGSYLNATSWDKNFSNIPLPNPYRHIHSFLVVVHSKNLILMHPSSHIYLHRHQYDESFSSQFSKSWTNTRVVTWHWMHPVIKVNIIFYPWNRISKLIFRINISLELFACEKQNRLEWHTNLLATRSTMGWLAYKLIF